MSLTISLKHVLVIVKKAEVDADKVGKVVGSRWINCNKGDSSDPDVRCRLVGQEVAPEVDPSGSF